VFHDGLGERRHTSGAGNQPLEVLILHEELTAVPSFEPALRERVEQLAAFQHPSFTRVRGAGKLTKGQARLIVASDRVPGVRLSEILTAAEQRLIPLEIDAALCLLRQIVPAMAALHAKAPDACHGALAPERIILTPDARAVIVEHVYGSALEQLRFSHERYWRELRIPLPLTGGLPRFDRRADVTQIGALALALILGRPLGDDEYPARVADIVEGVRAISATGLEVLPAGIRSWLSRTLQLDPRRSFLTAIEAQTELNAIAVGDEERLQASLVAFLEQYRAAVPESEAALDPMSHSVAVTDAPVEPVARENRTPQPHADPAPSPTAMPEPSAVVTESRTIFSEPSRFSDPSGEEAEPFPEEEPVESERPSWRGRAIAAAVVLIALGTGGTYAARVAMQPPPSGTLAVNSNPAGAQVIIDGNPKGATPLTLELPPGDHVMVLSANGQARTIPVSIAAGAQVSQFIELPTNTLAEAAPPAPIAPPAPAANPATPLVVAGWISITAPIDVQVYEGGRLVGTSQSQRIMLGVGRHELALSNETLGYKASRVVQVTEGKVTPIAIELPKGTLALNANPWAEVWVDGEKVGETPIGNVPVSIGTHDVLFRHPQLGEQRHAVTVTLAGPARVSAEFKKP
jgi:serine/threonine protein kinase